MASHSFGFYCIALFGIILLRYFCIAGGTYVLFYASFTQSFIHPVSDQPLPTWRSIQHDLHLSTLSAVVFALAAAFVLSSYGEGHTRLYSDVQAYGLWYLPISYGAVLFLQDTYFYFTHRLFHHPALFPLLHRGHHHAHHPTPWTSFAFDPLEAVIQSLFLIAIVYIIPLHFIILIAILATMTVWAVLNHLGLSQLPSTFPHHWLGKWFIGPAHHSIHHLKYTKHYGLYFVFWDKLLNTQDLNYLKVTSRK